MIEATMTYESTATLSGCGVIATCHALDCPLCRNYHAIATRIKNPVDSLSYILLGRCLMKLQVRGMAING